MRMIALNASGQVLSDGTVSLTFTLTGVADKSEADAITEAVGPKLKRVILRVMKKRGSTVLETKEVH